MCAEPQIFFKVFFPYFLLPQAPTAESLSCAPSRGRCRRRARAAGEVRRGPGRAGPGRWLAAGCQTVAERAWGCVAGLALRWRCALASRPPPLTLPLPWLPFPPSLSPVEVEATLLVLRPSGAAPPSRPLPPPPAAAAGASVPAVPHSQQQQAQQPRPGGPQRLPPTSWNALSALAGGTAKSGAGARQAQQAQQAGEGVAAAAARAPPGFNFFQGGAQRGQQAQQATAAQQQAQPAQPGRQPPVPVARAGPPAAAAPPQQAQQAQRPSQQAQQAQQGAKLSVGDYLADSLTAQSLDLPPAVSWRIPGFCMDSRGFPGCPAASLLGRCCA